MGKGFENYMSKKWFHPTNVDNLKRVYAAQQKNLAEKKRQQDLRDQYEREQEVFSNKQLMGDEKARLGLSFMYNAPTSTLKDQDKKNDLHDSNADSYEWNDQKKETDTFIKPANPNARCLKCKRLGHLNTDQSCPMYGKSLLDTNEIVAESNLQLNKDSIKNYKPSTGPVLPKEEPPEAPVCVFTLESVESFPPIYKKKLLKRLKKLEKKGRL